MVKVGRKSEIPGSDDHSWVPTRGDAVPKCVNISIISYTVTIPSNPLTATEMVDTEAEKSPPKSEDNEIRRKSYISDKSLGWKRYLGVLYTLLSTSMLSLSSNILKLMGHIHPLPLGMYGFLVGIFLSLPFIWYTVKIEKKSAIDSILPLSSNKKVLFFMWMRSLLGVLIQYGFIASFQYITVADARTILASSVVTVNVFGCICFGEKFGCVPILVAVVALCGIGVMTRPPILTGAEAFDSNILLGVSIAFVCMLLVTGIILCLRFLQNVHHGVLSLFSSSCAFISILPFAIAYDKWQAPQKLWDIFGMLGVGISWFLGNTFLALALQVEEAGIVSLIRTSEVIFTFCWQMLLLQIYPDLIRRSSGCNGSGCSHCAKICGFIRTQKCLEEKISVPITVEEHAMQRYNFN
ncbi:unnamed protein product [Orchesella dallaii]|uniref:EamA domain-containing protein n=1 Tax=Orchesella dallaii TaxID=48710 RepID=A0ABP1Q0X4_9HEXA